MRMILLPAAVLALAAQAPAQSPDSAALTPAEQAIAAFALRPPDEASPFFASRELARQEIRTAGRDEVQGAMMPDGNAEYPKIRASDTSFSETFVNFFTSMFASVRLGRGKDAKNEAQLRLEPEDFSLSDRREIEVTYSVRNQTRRIMRLDYPTTQRIEILTTDPSGKVLDRWSDDRAFENREGIVFINPGERISYSEKLPTREMKAGETYTIAADVAGYPEYTATRTVAPSP